MEVQMAVHIMVLVVGSGGASGSSWRPRLDAIVGAGANWIRARAEGRVKVCS